MQRVFQNLMVKGISPIIDFYPDLNDIKIDFNGKKQEWEAVMLIPFIDEVNLQAKTFSKLTTEKLHHAEIS